MILILLFLTVCLCSTISMFSFPLFSKWPIVNKSCLKRELKKNTFHITCCVYPSRQFSCELQSFGDVSGCLPFQHHNRTRWHSSCGADSCINKHNNSCSASVGWHWAFWRERREMTHKGSHRAIHSEVVGAGRNLIFRQLQQPQGEQCNCSITNPYKQPNSPRS